jgi:hypothetical protein
MSRGFAPRSFCHSRLRGNDKRGMTKEGGVCFYETHLVCEANNRFLFALQTGKAAFIKSRPTYAVYGRAVTILMFLLWFLCYNPL